MGSFHTPQITDDLLSAYIDNVVSHDERSLVERALAADPEVEWRLETLRHTVNLLKQLSPLVLPRSFSISELDVAKTIARRRQVKQRLVQIDTHQIDKHSTRHVTLPPSTGKVWFFPGQFWRKGNPFLRNVASLCLLLCLLLVGGDRFFTPSASNTSASSTSASSTMTQQIIEAPIAAIAETETAEEMLAAQSIQEAEPIASSIQNRAAAPRMLAPSTELTQSDTEPRAPLAKVIQNQNRTAFPSLDGRATQVGSSISSALPQGAEALSFFDPYRRQLSQFGFGFLLLLSLSLWWLSRSTNIDPQPATTKQHPSQIKKHN